HPGTAFMPETTRGITYVLEVEGVEGYKVQYFDYDNLYDKLYGEGMSESQADEIASKLSNDKVYQDLMFLLGSDGSMESERELLVPAETKMRIVEISDEREETGYIHVKLEVVGEDTKTDTPPVETEAEADI